MDGVVRLHGHGVRTRLLLGPMHPGGTPEQREVTVRRYRCQCCRIVVSVVPRGVLPRIRYTALAVVTALAAWGLGQMSSAAARDAVSPWSSSGSERFHGWRSLRRWARAGPRLWPSLHARAKGPPRQRAQSIATQLAARAPTPSGDVLTDALAGLHFT